MTDDAMGRSPRLVENPRCRSERPQHARWSAEAPLALKEIPLLVGTWDV